MNPIDLESPTHLAYLLGGLLAALILWPLVSASIEAVSPNWRLNSVTNPMPRRIRKRLREVLSSAPTPEVHAAWTRLGVRTADSYPTAVTALHRRRGLTRWTRTTRYVTCGLVIRPALATAEAWTSKSVRRELASALGVKAVYTYVLGTALPDDSPWWLHPENADSRPARRFRLRHPVPMPGYPSLMPRPGDVVVRWDIPIKALTP